MHARTIFVFCAIALAVFAPKALDAAAYQVAVLQGLDKVTARVSTIQAPVGQVIRFGTLEIVVRKCDKRPPEETPESTVFLDIWEAKPGEPSVELFRGWMFASSPALNGLEHPVYDVWALDCQDPAEAVNPSEGPAAGGTANDTPAAGAVDGAGRP